MMAEVLWRLREACYVNPVLGTKPTKSYFPRISSVTPPQERNHISSEYFQSIAVLAGSVEGCIL